MFKAKHSPESVWLCAWDRDEHHSPSEHDQGHFRNFPTHKLQVQERSTEVPHIWDALWMGFTHQPWSISLSLPIYRDRWEQISLNHQTLPPGDYTDSATDSWGMKSHKKSKVSNLLKQWYPTFLAPGTSFVEDDFSKNLRVGLAWGWFKCITFFVHFISIITASAPPQIIRHSILEVGDPCATACKDRGGSCLGAGWSW